MAQGCHFVFDTGGHCFVIETPCGCRVQLDAMVTTDLLVPSNSETPARDPRKCSATSTWAMNFQNRQPHHAVFPSEAYGFAGNNRKPHTRTIDPAVSVGDIKHSWQTAKRAAGIKCRFHDCRHTACTRLLERGASLGVVASIMGWSASTTASMARRYSHIGSEAQRAAMDTLSVAKPSFTPIAAAITV